MTFNSFTKSLFFTGTLIELNFIFEQKRKMVSFEAIIDNFKKDYQNILKNNNLPDAVRQNVEGIISQIENNNRCDQFDL